MPKFLLALLGLCLAAAAAVHAAEAPPTAADPELEAKMLRVATELRCLVCQNETIAASHADLAVDLRNQIREMLRQGQSERQILDYMTARYGDFVLYKPPLRVTTVLLWAGPGLLLLAGFVVLFRILRSRRQIADEAPLSAAERERAARLLAGETTKDKK